MHDHSCETNSEQRTNVEVSKRPLSKEMRTSIPDYNASIKAYNIN